MLSPEELRESPLFQSISYESYLAMYDCFRAVNRTFRPYEVMYDYSSGSVSASSEEPPPSSASTRTASPPS